MREARTVTLQDHLTEDDMTLRPTIDYTAIRNAAAESGISEEEVESHLADLEVDIDEYDFLASLGPIDA